MKYISVVDKVLKLEQANKELLEALGSLMEITNRPDDMYDEEGFPTEELNNAFFMANQALKKAKGE